MGMAAKILSMITSIDFQQCVVTAYNSWIQFRSLLASLLRCVLAAMNSLEDIHSLSVQRVLNIYSKKVSQNQNGVPGSLIGTMIKSFVSSWILEPK